MLTDTPVQRFKCSLATTLTCLGPGWFAIPSLYDSFIRYSMPVYPGAIRTKASVPHCCWRTCKAEWGRRFRQALSPVPMALRATEGDEGLGGLQLSRLLLMRLQAAASHAGMGKSGEAFNRVQIPPCGHPIAMKTRSLRIGASGVFGGARRFLYSFSGSGCRLIQRLMKPHRA